MAIDYFGQMGDAEDFNPRNYGLNEHYRDWDFDAREGSPLEFFLDVQNALFRTLFILINKKKRHFGACSRTTSAEFIPGFLTYS